MGCNFHLARMRSGGVIVPQGVNGLDAMSDLLFDRVPTLEELLAGFPDADDGGYEE